jgi:hypothetical protein
MRSFNTRNKVRAVNVTQRIEAKKNPYPKINHITQHETQLPSANPIEPLVEGELYFEDQTNERNMSTDFSG